MYNHQLNAFVAAAECRSFSKAAGKMFISTPALIQQINLLEKNIGVPLFIRSHSGVTLTKSGEKIYEYALKMISLSEEAKVRAINASDMAATPLKVGIIYSGVNRILRNVLPLIRQRIPHLNVEYIQLANNPSAWTEPFDILESIEMHNLENSHYKFKRFSSTKLSCGIPYTHPLTGRKQLSLEDLNQCTILLASKNLLYIKKKMERELKNIRCEASIIVEDLSIPAAFTKCVQRNYLMLLAENYNDSVINLDMVPLKTDFEIPYGLIFRDDPQKPLIYHFVSTAAEIYATGR